MWGMRILFVHKADYGPGTAPDQSKLAILQDLSLRKMWRSTMSYHSWLLEYMGYIRALHVTRIVDQKQLPTTLRRSTKMTMNGLRLRQKLRQKVLAVTLIALNKGDLCWSTPLTWIPRIAAHDGRAMKSYTVTLRTTCDSASTTSPLFTM